MENGNFREDLYYRLNVFPIHLPPLREREQDVITIAQTFMYKLSQRYRIKFSGFTQANEETLKKYIWPGNIRELQNVLERALILSKDGSLDLSHLISHQPNNVEAGATNSDRVMTEIELLELDKRNIIKALQITDNKVSGSNGAAALLGIPSTTLSSRMKKYGIGR